MTQECRPSRLDAAMVHVRAFRPGDVRQVEVLFSELQSHERSIEENRVDGALICPAYVKHLLEECRTWDGGILVAEDEGRVVGFICVLAGFDSRDMIEADSRYAYVTDLVVNSGMRGRGVGLQLLREAETFSRQRGARVMRLNVVAGNTSARGFYAKAGFRELEIKLIKPL